MLYFFLITLLSSKIQKDALCNPPPENVLFPPPLELNFSKCSFQFHPHSIHEEKVAGEGGGAAGYSFITSPLMEDLKTINGH